MRSLRSKGKRRASSPPAEEIEFRNTKKNKIEYDALAAQLLASKMITRESLMTSNYDLPLLKALAPLVGLAKTPRSTDSLKVALWGALPSQTDYHRDETAESEDADAQIVKKEEPDSYKSLSRSCSYEEEFDEEEEHIVHKVKRDAFKKSESCHRTPEIRYKSPCKSGISPMKETNLDSMVRETAENVRELSRLSLANHYRQEDRISHLYERMALMEKGGAELQNIVNDNARIAEDNCARIDAVAQQQDLSNAMIDILDNRVGEMEYSCTAFLNEANEWRGQVSTTFERISQQMDAMQQTTQAHMQSLHGSLQHIAAKLEGQAHQKAQMAFLVDHEVCGHILHQEILTKITSALSVHMNITDHPEDFRVFLSRCVPTDADRQRLESALPGVGRVRTMHMFGSAHNIRLAFEALRDWIYRGAGGEKIAPL